VKAAPPVGQPNAPAAKSPEGSGGWHAKIRGRLRSAPLVYGLLQQLARLGRAVRTIGPESPLPCQILLGIDPCGSAGHRSGGQLGDYFGGPWGYPLTIFRWCVLGRLAGARIPFVSVGAEPVRSPIGKRFFRWALALADYRSSGTRDRDG
jgi:hypothetical protein